MMLPAGGFGCNVINLWINTYLLFNGRKTLEFTGRYYSVCIIEVYHRTCRENKASLESMTFYDGRLYYHWNISQDM